MEPSEQRPLRRSDGTLGERRRQLPWPEGKRFRILSIDGGGIRGILPASILAEFEREYLGGHSAGDYFDLIAGTSTGGIIALGLSIGLPASDILQVYFDHGEEIFPSSKPPLEGLKRLWAKARSLAYYQYDREPLERELRRIFGARAFGDAQRRLCIPSFDGFTEVNIFKTPHHPDFKLDWREEMVTVALATSAAPTYFSIYRDGQRRFADGGVWANNPVMVALVDALSCNELDRDQIDILSLGCGDTELTISDAQVLRGGLWHWRDIVSSAMHLSSQNALGQAAYIAKSVKIESGAKSALDPNSVRTIVPYVDADAVDLDLAVSGITVVDAERTFWDKVVILHGLRRWFEIRGQMRGDG